MVPYCNALRQDEPRTETRKIDIKCSEKKKGNQIKEKKEKKNISSIHSSV